MVLVDLGDIEDPEERERYLEFLAENDITFVRSSGQGTDTPQYIAEVTLVSGEEAGNQDRELQSDAASGYVEENDLANNPTSSKAKKILKSSRPTQETLRMLEAFRNSSRESSDYSCYTNFCSLIQNRQQLQPRERSRKWVLGLINDLYEERARCLVFDDEEGDDTDGIDGFGLSGSAVNTNDPEMLRIFPVFVMDHITKRYGLRRIVDQVSWDLVYNVHAHRRQKLMVEVFARFLEEYYDDQDLIFFLRVKHVVDKTIRKCVRSSWTKEFYSSSRMSGTAVKADAPIFLRWAEVVSIAKAVYGSGSNLQYQHFLELVNEHSVGENDSSTEGHAVDSTQLLHLAVAQFHDTRAQSSSVNQEQEALENKQQVLEAVFENAQAVYRQKLKELGFAETVASRQLQDDFEYQQRLDEMCHAIKQSLLRSSSRDSLSDVNEYTIREWAMGLLSREVKEKIKSSSPPTGRQKEEETFEQPPIISLDEAAGHFTRNRDRKKKSPTLGRPGPSPPLSPHPPPPPPERTSTKSKFVPTYAETLGNAEDSESDYQKRLAKKREELKQKTGGRSEKLPIASSSRSVGDKNSGRNGKNGGGVVPAQQFPSTSPSQQTPTEAVMKEIQANLDRNKEAYMRSLMSATEGLPPPVVLEIEKEVRSQLDKKTRQILKDVIGGDKSSSQTYLYSCDAVPDACSFSKLEMEFRKILRSFNESDGSYYHMSKNAEDFSRTLLNTTELRQEIEPLVALLVTYASARLGNHADGEDSEYIF